ncbi:MAG: universal stress protein [Dehalococcoidia bacterium]|nr:universal stress protein [Dehalococcoidia bacterium]MCA9851254.1 universal stress protein [Dehalococcoidia bacterium]MCA9856517.1 universal stress protein [Dehalococcoidia bacterium]MCB9482455.1 universal stress protein [Dehalococcoidia bacterium]MCB9491274.1 universal stress protein [Dehalococcoidia bacterium]
MAVNPLQNVSSILVPVDGTSACHTALAVAADIAKRHKAHIHLLYVIQVPRTIALDATLEGELQRAEEILDRAERIAEGYGVAVAGELVQARQTGHAIVDEAVERNVDLVILGIGYNRPYGRFELGSEAKYVLEHASAPVWLIRDEEPSAQ